MSTISNWWVRMALINLCIVAGLGVLMRYKIGFEFPHFNQKYLQEAHSHFAFAGWITHCLFFLLVGVLQSNLSEVKERLYHVLITVNLVAAYGMLICFAIQGYGPISLFFSTVSLITGYVFAFFALKDLSRFPIEHPGKKWIQAALWMGILSTVGTMVLSQMMATKNYDQDIYLGSVFFYLHFQYNGWFLFACVGIFLDYIKEHITQAGLGQKAFWLMFLSCIPAYFLSTLWADLPMWLYIIVVIAAFMQVLGWLYLIRLIKTNLSSLKSTFTKVILLLFLMVGMAITLKFLLQLGSTIPFVSKLAFGFRPIVIAYLHLVLLVITTVYLITFLIGSGHVQETRLSRTATLIFAGGAISTEILLMIQGIAGFSYAVVPLVKEMLLLLAIILFSSSIMLISSTSIKDKTDLNQPLS